MKNLKLTFFGSSLLGISFLFLANFGFAQSDAVALYEQKCASCHGNEPGPSNFQPIHLTNFTSENDLASYIENNMPVGAPGDCIAGCAQALAEYLYLVVSTEVTPPDAAIKTPLSIIDGIGEAPFTITFEANESTGENQITSYHWNFGDGGIATGIKPTHTYATPGLYEATLTVTNAQGLTGTDTRNITVYAPGDPIVVDLRNSTNLEGEAPLHASFSVFTSYCKNAPCQVFWDFGDTTTSAERALGGFTEHDYNQAGAYTVTATITDSQGNSESDTLTVNVLPSESFASYVQQCKTELNFKDEDIPATLDCAKGDLFARPIEPINDFVGHVAVTDKVDLVFACRWLMNANRNTQPPFVQAESIEIILHNRENGNTCFFKTRDKEFLPSLMVSPTVAAKAATGTPEAEYWEDPIEVKRKIPCTGCHVAGPYLASPRIAPFLAKLGLLNDGHDTFGLVRDKDDPNLFHGNYKIVGETFKAFKEIAADANVPAHLTCANGCHSVGYRSTMPDISIPLNLLPSLRSVIHDSGDWRFDDVSVVVQGVMPVNNPPIGTADDSDYTWINRDTPLSGPNDSDIETFHAAKTEYKELLNYCRDPGYILVRAAGSDTILKPPQFADDLETFNAQDGVSCRRSAQIDGHCNDFRVRYQCTNDDGQVTTTNWYNTHSPDNEGDFERRADHDRISAGGKVCYGQKVTGFEVSSRISSGWTAATPGPLDRLEKFDRHGLICRNADQSDGQCENYVVKFVGCFAEPIQSKIASVWSRGVLTAAGTGNDADVRSQPLTPSWNTQNWIIEPLEDTRVRIKNVAQNRYLNVQNNSNYADVVLYDYQEDWGSMQWIVENVGSNEVRFKNVWSGYYLTVSDNGNYSDLKAQPLNVSWASQRWRINP